MTYSTEQQTQIIKMKSEGKSSRKIANELGLSKSGVNDWWNKNSTPKSNFYMSDTFWFDITPLNPVEKKLVDDISAGQQLFGTNSALTDMLVHAQPSTQVKIVNHVDDYRKDVPLKERLTNILKPMSLDEIKANKLRSKEKLDEIEKREEPLMKIVTSPLRSGGKTHMYIGDSQVKPDVSFEYLRCKGEYIVEKKPDVVVFGGDFADMPSLSSYDKGKGKAEGKRVKKDIEAAIKGMQTLLKPLYDFQQKQLREFGFIGYKPRMLIVLGNHEDRITRYTNDNPELIDFISIDSLKYEEQGLEVYPFLEPVLVDGITYIHYLPNEFNGKPQGGNALRVLADFGGSITQGHKQILTVATRFAPATGQQTWFLQAGACYDHNEEYKGLYNNNHFRGLIMKYNLDGKGNYDLHTVSLKHIMDKYSWL